MKNCICAEQVNEEIIAAFDGHRVSVIAYGATGTGKTYSINHVMEKSIREIDSLVKKVLLFDDAVSISFCLSTLSEFRHRDDSIR